MKIKSKPISWWIFGCLAFLIFIILQIPANWLVSKYFKNNQILSNVSGNLWQGQADWRYANLQGSLHWTARPLDLFKLRLGAELNVQSGATQLQGIVGYGLGKKMIIRELHGEVAPDTLKALVNWQWSANRIQLNQIQFNYQKASGFNEAQGQLNWAGGNLGYQFAQRQERMDVPPLQGQLLDRDGQLNIDVRDQQRQKMINLALDKDLMLDVQLTQRFLLNVPSYNGKAGLDTFVVSTRQPLASGTF